MHTSLSKKLLAGLLSLVMVLSLVAPSMGTQAASKFSLTDKKSVKSGVTYKYQLKGVSKNQYVKVTRNVSGEKVVYNKKALTKTKKVYGTGKTLNLYVTYGEKEENYTGKFTVKVYGKKTNKCYKTLVEKVTVKVPEKEEPEEPVEVLDVIGVNAANATTIVIAGTKLNELKAENIKVSGQSISSFNAATDGKSATVMVNGLEDGKEYTVTVKVGDEEKTFTIKYTAVVATTVEVDTQNVDYFTKGQAITFKVNGAATTVDALIKEGYVVTFTAVPHNVVATGDGQFFFEGGANNSFDGVVFCGTDASAANSLDVGGVWKVCVSLAKNGQILTSEYAKVTVVNDQVGSEAILDYDITRSTVAYYAPSTTLLVGETDTINYLLVKANGKELEFGTTAGAMSTVADAVAAETVKISSSNEAVISVAGDVLTAMSAGTSTITLKYGSATKTINYTVKSNSAANQRTPKKVVWDSIFTNVFSQNLTAYTGNNASIANIVFLDQYGDVFDFAGTETISLTASDPDAALTTSFTASAGAQQDYKTAAAITQDIKNKVIQVKVGAASMGYLTYSETKSAKATYKPVLWTTAGRGADVKPAAVSNIRVSKDLNLDLYNDSYAIIRFFSVDAKGVIVGDGATLDCSAPGTTIEVGDTTIATAVASNGKHLCIQAQNVGRTTIKVTDTDGKVHTFNVVVNSTSPSLKNITFNTMDVIKSAGVQFKAMSLLPLKGTDEDPIITIGTTQTVSGKTRVHFDNSSATSNVIYADVNGNATYDNGVDIVLATISMSASTTASTDLTTYVGNYDLEAPLLTNGTAGTQTCGKLYIMVNPVDGSDSIVGIVSFDVD